MTNLDTTVLKDKSGNVPMEKTLNLVLSKIQDPKLPPPLPIAHLTSVGYLQKIIDGNFTLKPQFCKVFERELLYFSYGGVFHRYGSKPIQKDENEATYLPIAFVFKPELIKNMACFYPYDTGAAHEDMYGDCYSKEMQNWEKYKVDNDGNFQLPSKIVYSFYETNKNYGNSQPVQEFNKEHESIMEPMQQLLKFLKSRLQGVDHRKNAIECQTSKPILLNNEIYEYIMWIGCPRENVEQVFEMCEKINESLKSGHYPYIHGYDTEQNAIIPRELIYAHLQIPAKEYIKTYFLR